jgi:hypothetical protein
VNRSKSIVIATGVIITLLVPDGEQESWLFREPLLALLGAFIESLLSRQRKRNCIMAEQALRISECLAGFAQHHS